MKISIVLLSVLFGLTIALPTPDDLDWLSHDTEAPGGSPSSRKRQYSTGTLHPSFTHVWTVTPGVGYFEASPTGYVRFLTTETDQTFQPDASLRGHNATVGFDVPQGKLTDGMEFQVFTALSTLVLEKNKDKANTNDSRGDYVARFVVKGGVAQLADGEKGRLMVPDREQFTLQIVGSFRVEFQFDASTGQGLTVTRAD
ncbi:uncharacterized protein N0V89_011269 [Didymosphaeria variabile]|uniref:Uncharacterized protein n=1 Tax=Didymosphaeria variabile TaxID=1932322 RepID=A0A9W8XD62_9PLEO|nr:uncharacterized protein N0V89_011269 [Didymosphaeria variabile]KAJ4347328.1 hypothetical protein N0V89_011269 [Didymosphaeria variabile]